MNFWKKRICLFLALVMMLTAGAIPVHAAEDGEEPAESMISSSSSMSFGAEGEPEESLQQDASAAQVLAVSDEQTQSGDEENLLDEEAGEETEPEPEESSEGDIRNDVPQYFQTDYPDVPYSDGTVATSGCSMASIAMVAAYLRKEEWSPADLARRFGNYEASNIQRMESAATVLDLKYNKVFKWAEVVRALKKGKIAIVMVDHRSGFTSTQHFLVLTGISAEGLIFVNDSYGPNYSNGDLMEGFENGFDPKKIMYGFCGGWIFEDYVAPVRQASRYQGVTLTEEEKYLMAKIIWLESRGESFEGQQAIAEIILNRLVSDRFPNTIRDVIYAEGQFSTTKFLDTAKPGELQYKAIECAMYQKSVLPIDVFFFGRTRRTTKAWGCIGGHIFCYSEN